MGQSGQPSIQLVTDVPGAMRHLSKLVLENTRIVVNPYMTRSQLTAAYEAKANLALEAGQFFQQNLSRCPADWEGAPRQTMAKWLGFEASQLDRPTQNPLEAADYADPLNQFQTLNGTLVMLRALPLFAYEYPELLGMFTDYSPEPSQFQQESLTRVINIPAVQKYNGALDANSRPHWVSDRFPG